MKKTILIILLLYLIFPCANAQINRNIWGLSLGESTKTQVTNVLRQKGYKYKSNPDGSISFKANNLQYGGGFWTYVNFNFFNNKLSDIAFQNNENACIENIYSMFIGIKDKLEEKYGNYKSDGLNDIYYYDSQTFLSLQIIDGYISLIYTDLYLHNLREQKEMNEL